MQLSEPFGNDLSAGIFTSAAGSSDYGQVNNTIDPVVLFVSFQVTLAIQLPFLTFHHFHPSVKTGPAVLTSMATATAPTLALSLSAFPTASRSK